MFMCIWYVELLWGVVLRSEQERRSLGGEMTARKRTGGRGCEMSRDVLLLEA